MKAKLNWLVIIPIVLVLIVGLGYLIIVKPSSNQTQSSQTDSGFETIPLKVPEKDSLANLFYDSVSQQYILDQKADSALMVLNQWIPSIPSENHDLLASAYYTTSSAYFYSSDLSKAVEYGIKAIKEAEITNDEHFLADINIYMGFLYVNLYDTLKNVAFTEKGLDLALKGTDTTLIISGYINAGFVGVDYPKEIKLLKEGLRYAMESRDSLSYANILSNLGANHMRIGDYKRAQGYFSKSFTLYKNLGNEYGLMVTAYNLGILNVDYLKDGNTAITYLKQGLKIAQNPIYQSQEIGFTYFLSKAYQLNKDYKQALDYRIQHQEMNEAYRGEEVKKEIAALQEQYNAEKREAEISNLTIQNALERNVRNAVIALAIILVLGVSIGVLYLSNRKQLALKQIFTRQLVQNQEAERQRIAKELHDSVGQNILFIKNQLIKQQNESLLPSVNEAMNEVRNISKDLYPNQLEVYGLAAAVNALAEKIKGNSDLFISCDLDALTMPLSKDQNINMYRIIQECLSNSLKHAQASIIRITANVAENMIELIVQDNGLGFQKSTADAKAQHSFGLLNLEERIQMLKGKMSIESNPGAGTKSSFIIPV